ncbi:MAG: choice-of-anchor D domain-containing protein [Pseudomonadota bacterium]
MRRYAAFLMTSVLGAGLGCSPAVVTGSNCKTSLDCPASKVCVDGLCQDSTRVACTSDAVCLPLGATCINGFCSTTSMVDAGPGEDAASGTDSGTIVSGQGIIAVDTELPIDFGDPLFGASVVRVLTVRNAGDEPLHIYRVGRVPGTSDEFALDPDGAAADSVLLPEQTLDVTITYVLADGEADIGELFVLSDAASCAQFCQDPHNIRVPLYSEFKGARNLDVTPASHDFGFVVGGQTSLFAPFTLSNEGTLSKVLTVGDVRLEGTDASHFGLLFDPLPYYLTPAGSQIVRVRYAPGNTAFHTAELVIEANSDDPERQVVRVPLTGRSVPSASLSVASPLDFGVVEVGQASVRTTTVHNGGGMAATITSPERFEFGDQGFSLVSPVLPQIVQPGQQVTFTLRFAPANAGDKGDNLFLDHDAAGSPLTVGMTGRGKDPPQGYSSLRIEQRFSRALAGTGCAFQTNYQNVDLEVVAGGAICDKNAGGCQADVCACNLGSLGSATWSCNNCGGGTASSEIVSNFGSGADGSLDVRAYYFDACTAGYFGVSGAALQAVCSFPGTREACFPYEVFSQAIYVEPCQYTDHCISESLCMVYVPTLANRCMSTAATQVRTIISLSQGTSADRTVVFCTDLQSLYERQAVARIERAAGLFNLIGPLGSSREIAPSDPCGL